MMGRIYYKILKKYYKLLVILCKNYKLQVNVMLGFAVQSSSYVRFKGIRASFFLSGPKH